MKTLSLKLQDNIFADTEKILTGLKKPRNTYINEALEYYNRIQKRLLLAQQLQEESRLVAENSMEVLREWENIDPHLLDEYETD